LFNGHQLLLLPWLWLAAQADSVKAVAVEVLKTMQTAARKLPTWFKTILAAF
jgi:hypothetical protein